MSTESTGRLRIPAGWRLILFYAAGIIGGVGLQIVLVGGILPSVGGPAVVLTPELATAIFFWPGASVGLGVTWMSLTAYSFVCWRGGSRIDQAVAAGMGGWAAWIVLQLSLARAFTSDAVSLWMLGTLGVIPAVLLSIACWFYWAAERPSAFWRIDVFLAKEPPAVAVWILMMAWMSALAVAVAVVTSFVAPSPYLWLFVPFLIPFYPVAGLVLGSVATAGAGFGALIARSLCSRETGRFWGGIIGVAVATAAAFSMYVFVVWRLDPDVWNVCIVVVPSILTGLVAAGVMRRNGLPVFDRKATTEDVALAGEARAAVVLEGMRARGAR